MAVHYLRIVAAGILVAACSNPTAPSRGTASIAITGVAVADGGEALQGLGVDVRLSVTATADLLESNRAANPFVGPRLPFYVCFSADGARFTSTCLAGVDVGERVAARVVGPTESFGISMTTHVIAFVLSAEEYGLPVTAFTRFGAGDTVPASAQAVHVLPWVIHWKPRPAS
jgi:hypothetical protein